MITTRLCAFRRQYNRECQWEPGNFYGFFQITNSETDAYPAAIVEDVFGEVHEMTACCIVMLEGRE